MTNALIRTPGTTSAKPLERSPETAEEILSRAGEALPVLRERAAAVEENRHLPSDVVELLRGIGAFRAAMPKEWGGPELTSMQQAELVEILATGDPSTAWCAMIGMDSGIYSGYLADEAAREFFPRLDMVSAGWIYPQGRAERVPGGYKVSGHWRFGSGCTHTDVLVGGCQVYKDGEPEPDPVTGGPLQWRVMVARPDQFRILDTWFTTGLAGSGSRDYTAEDLFVPEEHSFSFQEPVRAGLLHASPDAILRKMSGVPLGMARAALDHVRDMAAHRADRETGTPWTTDVRVQSAIARAEAELAAARAGVYSSLETQWRALERGDELSADQRVATALARHHAFRTARSIVHSLFDLVGGASVYRNKSPMDRWLRDANTMCQHAVAQDSILQLTGQVLLGGKSLSPFF
ncbi:MULTISPECIES: acyl-CoA dehydrogenase family protein [unclassified Streptomyces]|uniref:acyl-CoA dehydrogenase family protein n=1 Tax=unclassified Streptomyces TaxID=2593676 RepID=UPI00081E1C65|nr:MULTISPECIES: acyl-CoA dehydrogenase family protein [unclassified Streptomyces]MYZ35136.1 acyl-CoA dehydrogenase [Streptomyces sp. SID4917]SCF73004.1 Acyl-CoA dehydrogenase [Streptomyces sp. MnatMP-M17]